MPRWEADRPVPHGTSAGYKRCTDGEGGRPCQRCRSFVSAAVAKRRRERQQGVPPAVPGIRAEPIAHGTTLAEARRCRQRPEGECEACRGVERGEGRRGGDRCGRCHQLLPADGVHDCPEVIGYHGPACPVCLQWLPSTGQHVCPGPRCSACGQHVGVDVKHDCAAAS